MQEEQRSFRGDDASDAEENEEGRYGDAEENEEGRCGDANDASEVLMEKETKDRVGVDERPGDVPHWQRWPRMYSPHWIQGERIAKEGLELGRKMVGKADGEVEGGHGLKGH